MSETEYKVLDHGYVRLIETWGSDERVIESARMSTQKGFEGWGPKEDGKPGDEKLLRYLWENKHSTPFEMAGLTIETSAPIFVFREWHRHRVPFGYSEACLAGDTEITCIGSGGLVRHYTIEHIYRMKHEGVVDHLPERSVFPPGQTGNGRSAVGTQRFRDRRIKANPKAFRVRRLPSCQNRTMRVLNEADETYETGEMVRDRCLDCDDAVATHCGRGRVPRLRASVREGGPDPGSCRPGDLGSATRA